MEENVEKPKERKQKTEKRKLNQDLIDQCLGSRPRPRRSVQASKLLDKHRGLGDVRTPHQGYELFMYHYRKQFRFEPVCNPWRLNLGRLAVPNVFINIELVKALASQYNSKKRTIQSPNGADMLVISQDLISNVFQLEGPMNFPFTIRDFLTEYHCMDTSYKR